jgi:hypothetical protein
MGTARTAILSEGQLAVLAAVGEERTAAVGDVLFQVGDLRYPFIAIIEGKRQRSSTVTATRSSGTGRWASSARSTSCRARPST